MDSLDKARTTQLENIQKKTGKNLDQFRAVISASGLAKHGEIRQMLIDQFGLGFGDATMLVHFAFNSDGQSAAEASGSTLEDVLSEIYSGPKSSLRTLHDQLVVEIDKLGDYSVAPKKGYISLRRKRQFAMIGPGSKGRLDIGLNIKGLDATERLIAQPAGGMCPFKVFLNNTQEIDAELINWLSTAYAASA